MAVSTLIALGRCDPDEPHWSGLRGYKTVTIYEGYTVFFGPLCTAGVYGRQMQTYTKETIRDDELYFKAMPLCLNAQELGQMDGHCCGSALCV